MAIRMEVEEKDGILIARVTEKRFDARVAPDFRQKLKERLEGKSKKLVLNLGAVEFLDSSGLGAIVSILKSLDSPGSMAICNDQGMVSYLFQFTRMNKVFLMVKSEEEASSKLSSDKESESQAEGATV